MKLSVIKGIVFAAIFFIAIGVFGFFSNRGNLDMTAQMAEATQPLIYMNIDGMKVNCLYGYQSEPDSAYMNDKITPLLEGRKLNFSIEKFGQSVKEVSFQVRSTSGERLIEETTVKDMTVNGDFVDVSITLKDLIDKDTEYMLIILVKTEENDQGIYFYTRIIDNTSSYVSEELAFLWDFHTRTFDKEAAAEITRYMESDSTGDNTSLNKVTIHSSFNQITWADLNVTKETEPVISILKLNGAIGEYEIRYIASTTENKEKRYYSITEYYSVRYTTNRMYLLDYERTMEEVFEPRESAYVNNKIELGIQSADLQMMESDDGKTIAFVNEKRLFSYDVTNSKMSMLFSFYDIKNLDARNWNDSFDIKIMNVDEVGNVTFMVYGYMNRGEHEGNIGVSLYYFDNVTAMIKEQVYIPYSKSYEILENDVEKLSYINKNNKLFLELEDSIYEINIDEQSYSVLVTDLEAGQCKVSASGQMVVWQDNADNVYASKKIHVMDLSTEEVTTVSAGENEYILALGFINEDLIYGLAKYDDIVTDNNGYLVFPMYNVLIQNSVGTVLKRYEAASMYVTGAVVEENQIILSRVSKKENESDDEVAYVTAADDQIVSAENDSVGKNYSEFGYSDLYEYYLRIVANGKIKASKVMNASPEFELFEGSKTVSINLNGGTQRYYVRNARGIIGIYGSASDAVLAAFANGGTVTNDNGTYIWKSETRSSKNQIMKITESSITDEKNSLAVCLDTMLSFEGISRNAAYMLSQGLSAIQILQENLENVEVLDLTGCDLDAMLYYINLDIPVLVRKTNGKAVLVTGFNDSQIVIMDPDSGALYKESMENAKAEFAQNGNCFITYMYLE